MVVSMFGFTNMTASAWTGSAALESDGRPNASADAASANVQFLVPETIYLDPTGENYTYFVDALDAGTPDANPMRTSGRIYFHADVPVSGLVIARSDARTTFGSGAGQTSTLSTSFSDTGTARAGDLIEWTATYSLGGNTFTSYAYTYIYRPSLDVIGQAFSAAVQPNGASTKLQKGVVSALTGFHAADSTYKGNRTWGGSTAVVNPQTVETNPIGTLGWGLKMQARPTAFSLRRRQAAFSLKVSALPRIVCTIRTRLRFPPAH